MIGMYVGRLKGVPSAKADAPGEVSSVERAA
jgi:hypothetical protein